MEEKHTSDTQSAAVKHEKEVKTNWFLQLFPPTLCFFLMPLLLMMSGSIGTVLDSVDSEKFYYILFLHKIVCIITFIAATFLPLLGFISCVIYLFKKGSSIYERIMSLITVIFTIFCYQFYLFICIIILKIMDFPA